MGFSSRAHRKPLGSSTGELTDAMLRDRERALAGLNVSRETARRLDVFSALLVKWQNAVNLVAPSTLKSLWTRHILDSAQIVSLGRHHQNWADMGSGAGFPGLIIAILAMAESEAGMVHLIESDQRKAAFLREAARSIGAPATIHAARVQDVLPELRGRVTAITARALAPLPALLELAEPLLTTGVEGFFPKGQAVSSELQEAFEIFSFESRTVPSQTDEKGRILVIRDLRRRSASVGQIGDPK